jgi:PqqD family protein of HPr-rel-A system
MPASKPRIRPDLTFVTLGEEGVLYDPLTELLHYLNPTAALVLQLCDGSASVKQTIEDLADAYEIEPQELDPEVRKIVRQFQSLGLVTPSREAKRLANLGGGGQAALDQRQRIRREVPRSD